MTLSATEYTPVRLLISGMQLTSVLPLKGTSQQKIDQITALAQDKLKQLNTNTGLSNIPVYNRKELEAFYKEQGIYSDCEYFSNVLFDVETPIKPLLMHEETRQYRSDEERKEWIPRIQMFKEAMNSNGKIFSLSVVPYAPWERQTWFYQKTFVQGPQTFIPVESIEREDKEFPSPRFKGFLEPFPGFDSEVCAPEELKRDEDKKVFSYSLCKRSDIYSIGKDVEPEDLRAKIQSIANAFFDDGYAREVKMIVLQRTDYLIIHLKGAD